MADIDWAEGLRLAKMVDSPSYSYASRSLGEWVRANAPTPSVVEQLKALSAGTVFTLSFDTGDTFVYVKQWDGRIRGLNGGQEGATYNLDVGDWQDYVVEVKWRPEDDHDEEGGN